MALDELRARVAASRAAQGLPPTITDPATIERAAAILRAAASANPDLPVGIRRVKREADRS